MFGIIAVPIAKPLSQVYFRKQNFLLTNDTNVVSLSIRKEGDMDITVKYMLRPVAHCKEGCPKLSWARQ
jgi:hypothetical protein